MDRPILLLLDGDVTAAMAAESRLSVALLPALAQHLAVSVEALLGLTNGTSIRGPTPKFQRHLEQLGRLPRARQRFVLDMLETVLQQASR